MAKESKLERRMKKDYALRLKMLRNFYIIPFTIAQAAIIIAIYLGENLMVRLLLVGVFFYSLKKEKESVKNFEKYAREELKNY